MTQNNNGNKTSSLQYQPKRKPTLSLKSLQVYSSHPEFLKNFHSGIKSKETNEAYTKTFQEFLFIVQEFSGEFEERADQFGLYAIKHKDKTKS